jgi:thioredoxin reductase
MYTKRKVTSVIKNNSVFELVTSDNELYQSKTIIISTGLKDVLPRIENISLLWQEFISLPLLWWLGVTRQASGGNYR